MSVKFIKIRFNIDKEPDRKAYETIQNADVSQSKFIMAAVNAYGGYLSAEQEKERFCRQVNDAIHLAMREIFGGANVSTPTPSVTEKPVDESGKIADDFLENFI